MKPHSIFSKRRSRREFRGFTLVELLVVIVIIVLLAALVFAVGSKAIDRARQAKAVSALKQVGSGCLAYSQENSNNINTVRDAEDPREGGNGQTVENSFWGRLRPYLFAGATSEDQATLRIQINQVLDQIFSTPDADTMKKTILSGSKIYHDGSELPVPIAFNEMVYEAPEKDDQGMPKDAKITMFRDSANVIHAGYGYGLFDKDDGKRYVERPTNGSTPDNNIYYLDNKSGIFLFLDGRVETLRTPIDERRFGVLK